MARRSLRPKELNTIAVNKPCGLGGRAAGQ
jgi:hypothetical protein